MNQTGWGKKQEQSPRPLGKEQGEGGERQAGGTFPFPPDITRFTLPQY